MEDKITKEKIKKYFNLTEKASVKIKSKVIKGKESEAKEIFDMVANYLSDAKFFEGKGDFVNTFAAINYAHGWIDCGVRLGVFDVKNNKLFTIK